MQLEHYPILAVPYVLVWTGRKDHDQLTQTNVMYNFTIPGGTLGKYGNIEITYYTEHTANANGKATTTWINGTHYVSNLALNNFGNARQMLNLWTAGDTGTIYSTYGAQGYGGYSPASFSIDTTQDMDFEVRGYISVLTDTYRLNAIFMKIYRGDI